MARARVTSGVLLVLSGLVPAPAARAQPAAPLFSQADPPCDSGDLLAGKLPWQWQDLRGPLALLTDQAMAPEGAQWDAPVGVVLETAAASVTYDLGRPTEIGALLIQADANDVYQVQGSLDGAPGSFQLLIEADNVRDVLGHGLRTRALRLARPARVRFLRVGEATGDGAFSLSELAAYCRAPEPFPPVMRRVSAAAAPVAARPWYKLDWWGQDASARFQMGLALFALLLLGWAAWAERTGREPGLPAGAPRWIAGLALAIHLIIALAVLFLTDWLPAWIPILALYLAVEFTLLVSWPQLRLATPLRALLRRRRLEPVRVSRQHGRRRMPAPVAGAAAVAGAGAGALAPAALVRRQLLLTVGILAFYAYWNFGAFHFSNYTHYHEAFHYYLGSKYFDELSYLRLYDCAVIAEAEHPELRRRVELRKITDLRTNLLGETTEVLAHPERCKQHFSPARWAAFRADTDYFRARLGVKRWEEALGDHGYNATPVWNITGSALANLAPASDTQLWWLTRVDPALVIAMLALIGWAYGWQGLCVALAVFGTNFPSRFTWNGGAYLRWDFLFAMTAGVCFVKKGRPLLGGYLVGAAALLRVFPGFLLLGPLMALAQQLIAQLRQQLTQTRGLAWWRRVPVRALPHWFRTLDRSCLAVVMGAALAVATLVPISLATSGGAGGYRAFVDNSRKHLATPLTNYMGWRTVVTYREAEAGRHLHSDRLADPWADWKAARLRTFQDRRWLYAAGVAVFAALLWQAVRGREAWEATALGSLMIAVVPELTGYFYSFLIVPALLWTRRRAAGLALLAVAAVTSFIDWAPTRFLPPRWPWTRLQMPTWLDEQYTCMSVVTLAGFCWILYELGFARRPAAAATDTTAAAAAAATDARSVLASPLPPPTSHPRPGPPGRG